MYFNQCPECNHTFVSRYEGEKEKKGEFLRIKCKACEEEFFMEDVIEAKVYSVKDFTAIKKKVLDAYPDYQKDITASIHSAWKSNASASLGAYDGYTKADLKRAKKTYVTEDISTIQGHEYLTHPLCLELFAKFPDPLSEYEKVCMSNFRIAEEDNGNWAKMEMFCQFSMSTHANALVNWAGETKIEKGYKKK